VYNLYLKHFSVLNMSDETRGKLHSITDFCFFVFPITCMKEAVFD
jgi:hypothetical protein